MNEEGLAEVGIAITAHDKLPDLILHDKQREWLLFVEAVTSDGPVTDMCRNELTKLVDDTGLGWYSSPPSPMRRSFAST